MLRISRETIKKNPLSSLKVLDDISFQISIISLIEFYSNQLGRCKVALDQIYCDVQALPNKIIGADRNLLESTVKQVISYFPRDTVNLHSQPDSSYLVLDSIPVEWEDLTTSMNNVRKSVMESITTRYEEQIPVLILKEKDRLKQELIDAKLVKESDFLVTCSLLQRDEIRTALDGLIMNAKERLYLTVAFYDTDVDCLSSYLVEHISRHKPDLRIMYRRKGGANDLITSLKKHLEPLGYEDFYRAFDYRLLKEPVKKWDEKGNLHAKIWLSENELLVGSTNLTHQSLNWNLEAAIYSRNESLIKKTTELFQSLWRAFGAPPIIE